jgi:hypothetical protein
VLHQLPQNAYLLYTATTSTPYTTRRLPVIELMSVLSFSKSISATSPGAVGAIRTVERDCFHRPACHT